MLFTQDLLKHTAEDHPDHPFLLDAQRDIKRLAEKINKGRRSAEEAEKEARVIQEIEAHIEGVEHVRHVLCSCLLGRYTSFCKGKHQFNVMAALLTINNYFNCPRRK